MVPPRLVIMFTAKAWSTPGFSTIIIRLLPLGFASIAVWRFGAIFPASVCVIVTAFEIGINATKLSIIVAIAIIDTNFLFIILEYSPFLQFPQSSLLFQTL